MLDPPPAESLPARELQSARQVAEQMRCELLASYGYAGLQVGFRYAEGHLHAEGEALSRRIIDKLGSRLSAALSSGITVNSDRVLVRYTRDYRAVARPRTLLYSACSGPRADELCSELLVEDGPVELLAEHAGRRLVRGRDATLGWTAEALGEASVCAPLESPRAPSDELDAWLEARLGTPYVLGGTSESGFDCSGLVQRAYAVTRGLVLPRHSRDQLRFAPAETAPAAEWIQTRSRPGDLLFIRDTNEGPCHVGVLTSLRNDHGAPSNRLVVVHASQTRGRVVADSVASFVEGTVRTAWVKAQSLAESYSVFVGYACIELPRSIGRAPLFPEP